MLLDEKTVLEIWLNPGLNLTIFRGTGPLRTQLPGKIRKQLTNWRRWKKCESECSAIFVSKNRTIFQKTMQTCLNLQLISSDFSCINVHWKKIKIIDSLFDIPWGISLTGLFLNLRETRFTSWNISEGKICEENIYSYIEISSELRYISW